MDSNSDPSEIVEHEGYMYEKKWNSVTSGAVGGWALWKCVINGCPGQLAMAAVRKKRWRRKRIAVHRNIAGNGLTAFVPRRPHNHQPGEAAARAKPAAALVNPAPASNHSDANTLGPKVLNIIDTFNLPKIKPLTSLTHIENIYPTFNIDNDSKSRMVKQTMTTTTDNGVNISNVNDTIEFQAVKPVTHNDSLTNLKERHLKDISITVDGTNIINKEKSTKDVLQIKSSMASQNKKEKIVCQVCDALFDKCCYGQHVKTVQHISAYDSDFKERIDFENYRIFSSRLCDTTTAFFNTIEKDFKTLVDHILLLENEVVIDVFFYALYHEESLIPENKNIAEVKHFNVYNKELTKNTNVYKLYKDVVNALIFQSDALKTSEFSWTLEETLYVELNVVRKLLKDEVTENSLVEITHNNQNDNLIETDKLQKTEPLQLFRCKQCNVYVVQKNHEQHLQTIAHQISLCYLNNEKIQINGQCSNNQFVSCRILSPKHNISIDHFFHSIKSDVLDLIDRVIKLQNRESVNVNVQMFGLYSHKDLLSETDNLGDVKSFMIKNEMLSADTMLLVWFKKISDSFKSYHQSYLKSMPSTYYLDRVMFLDLFFYEITTI